MANNKYENKTLLIIGTGPRYKLPYLRKMLDDGINIVVFVKKINWENELDVKVCEVDTDNSKDVFKMLDNLKLKIDGVITMWDQDVYNVALTAKKLGLPHIPLNAARVVRDKSLMRHYAVNNPYTPKFRIVENEVELKRAFEEIGIPAVIKPSGVSASINVRLLKSPNFENIKNVFYENLTTAETVINTYNLNPDDFRVMIYEEFVDGYEFSVEGYVYKYNYYPLGILEKKQFQFEDTFHPTGDYAPPKSITEAEQKSLQDTVAEIVGIYGLNNCIVHAEMKHTKNGSKLMEVAARPIGLSGVEIMKLAYGVDLFEINLDLAFGIEPEINSYEKPKQVESHIINPDKNGILKRLDVDLNNIPDSTYFKIVYEGSQTVVPPEGFQHLGWITVTRNNLEETKDALKKAIEQIHLEIED